MMHTKSRLLKNQSIILTFSFFCTACSALYHVMQTIYINILDDLSILIRQQTLKVGITKREFSQKLFIATVKFTKYTLLIDEKSLCWYAIWFRKLWRLSPFSWCIYIVKPNWLLKCICAFNFNKSIDQEKSAISRK